MAFGSIGSIGTNTGTTNEVSCTITVANQNLVAGNFVVCVFAFDNTATTDGDEGGVTGVTDDATGGTNAWSKAIEFCNAQGAIKAGCTVSIWYSTLARDLPIGKIITAALSTSANRDATSSTGWAFTKAANSIVLLANTNSAAGDGVTAPGSLDAATANVPALRVRGVAIEYGTGTVALVATSSPQFTKFTDATQAGTTAAGSSVRAEFIISTGTGAASNPTMTSQPAADMANGYAAFTERFTYTLDCDPGAFAETGATADLKPTLHRVLDCEIGAYSETGATSTLKQTRNLIGLIGALSETGVNADAIAARQLALAIGSFAENGVAANLTPKFFYVLTGDAGSFAETGMTALTQKSVSAIGSMGAFNETGASATLTQSHFLQTSVGSYSETGNDADLIYGAGSTQINYQMDADIGAYSLAGASAISMIARIMLTASGALLSSGETMLKHGLVLVSNAGNYTETGATATLEHTGSAAYEIICAPGVFSVAGANARTTIKYRVIANGGVYTITGSAVLNRGNNYDYVYNAGIDDALTYLMQLTDTVTNDMQVENAA